MDSQGSIIKWNEWKACSEENSDHYVISGKINLIENELLKNISRENWNIILRSSSCIISKKNKMMLIIDSNNNFTLSRVENYETGKVEIMNLADRRSI